MKLIIIYISAILQLSDYTYGGILECIEDTDCLAQDATCVNELCECPTGKTLSYDASTCLQVVVGYGSSCEEDVQCQWLVGKHSCENGVCVCGNGWRYYQGKCIKASGLGEICTRNEDCFVSNDLLAMMCTDGKCDCNEGYYARGDYDCRPEGAIGDSCSLDLDCKFENAVCDVGICAKQEDENENSISKNIILKNDISEERNISVNLYEIGIGCTENEDCEDQNSLCSPITKVCTCKRGYFYRSSTYGCVAELGTVVGCTVHEECSIQSSRCVDGACHCPTNTYYSNANNQCFKASFTPLFTCNNDYGCSIMGPDAICVEENILESYCKCPLHMELDENFICRNEAECSGGCVINSDCASLSNSICSQSVCICADDYRLENDICLPNIGGKCDEEFACLLDHTYCNDESNVCICEENYIANGGLSCLKIVTELNSNCEADIQCSEINNSFCKNGVCSCNDGLIEQNGICIESEKYMGDYCISSSQCFGTSVQCRNNLCQCSSEMEPTADKTNCQKRSNAASIKAHLLLLIITFGFMIINTQFS